PRREQHLDHRRRPRARRLATEFIWGQLLEPDFVANRITDGPHLRSLTHRLWTSEDVVRAGVAIVEQGSSGHCTEIALVDRCGLHRTIRPAHDAAVANLWRPPVERVGREHPGAKDRRGEAGIRQQTLDAGVHGAQRVRLLKERVRGLVWRRKM